MYVPRTILESVSPMHRGQPMLFVHTPKCGGSFVGKAFHKYQKKCISLRSPDLHGHLLWQDYNERLALMGRSIDDYTTFSVIRNPFSWHVSWFTYIRGPKGGKRSGYHIEHALFQKMSFCDYVDWLVDPNAQRTKQFDMGKQVSDWILDSENNIAVDYVLRQETLETDLRKMADSSKIRIRIPHKPVNVSNATKRYQDFYTSKDVDLITKRHQRDIQLFGYEF